MADWILVTDTGIYVNDRLPCLKKYRKNVCVVKLETTTEEINTEMEYLDVSADKDNLDTSKSGYESWQYQCIHNHAKEILPLLHGNVVILGDLNLDALYVLDLLQKSYSGNIHLILPLPFGRLVKETIQYELLSDLNRIKTLAVYDPYQLSIERYGDTETEHVRTIIDEQTKHLLKRYRALSRDMLVRYGYEKYFFDFEKDQYISTESMKILEMTDYAILGIERPYNWLDMSIEEHNIFIKSFQIPVPRPDGKLVCSQLRSIRKKFAQLNGIQYEFKECEYHGPCAGTCQKCDEEAKELKELAEKSGSIKYPEVQLEELV